MRNITNQSVWSEKEKGSLYHLYRLPLKYMNQVQPNAPSLWGSLIVSLPSPAMFS